jgi:hypothetical protein
LERRYEMEALKRLAAYQEGSRKKANKKESARAVSPLHIRSLAEGIILQAIEDLWDKDHNEESFHFFKGEGFKICAGLACLNGKEQSRIINMVADTASRNGNGNGKVKSPVKQKLRYA